MPEAPDDVCQRFSSIRWHDSKLRSVKVAHVSDGDQVILDLELIVAGGKYSPATLVFEDAVFFFADVDLQAKRECADDVSSAGCHAQSDLLKELQNERLSATPNALAGYYHFEIYLIPTGGSLNIIAARFHLA